jgi:hypothetical protein
MLCKVSGQNQRQQNIYKGNHSSNFMLRVRGKKGAEESNVIIFIILALVVAGLVVYFSWEFFGTGVRLVDGNDPSVTIAIESCKAEMGIQPSAYCDSAKSVKIKGGGEMIVSCEYLNSAVIKGSLNDVAGKPSSCPATFVRTQCGLILRSETDKGILENTIVNGDKCSTKIQVSACPDGFDKKILSEFCYCGTGAQRSICEAGQYCYVVPAGVTEDTPGNSYCRTTAG